MVFSYFLSFSFYFFFHYLPHNVARLHVGMWRQATFYRNFSFCCRHDSHSFSPPNSPVRSRFCVGNQHTFDLWLLFPFLRDLYLLFVQSTFWPSFVWSSSHGPFDPCAHFFQPTFRIAELNCIATTPLSHVFLKGEMWKGQREGSHKTETVVTSKC